MRRARVRGAEFTAWVAQRACYVFFKWRGGLDRWCDPADGEAPRRVGQGFRASAGRRSGCAERTDEGHPASKQRSASDQAISGHEVEGCGVSALSCLPP